MNLPESNKLEIKYLSRLFDNMSECYKIFWFQSIVDFVIQDKLELTFEEIIDNMIADSWYMVNEYHLNLGPKDTLESLVKDAYLISKLSSSEKKKNVIDNIYSLNDSDINRRKYILTMNVPFRLQAPFMADLKGSSWSRNLVSLARSINEHDNLIYKFVKIDGLKSVILVDDTWAEYIKTNQEIIKGWIRYNQIKYLQKRNPGVPGIPNKIEPPQMRNLDKVKKYWKAIIDVCQVKDIYGHIDMKGETISIDHFIPWSYVTHDELWNLSPTTRSINSSKSNSLPEWDKYFISLSNLEYSAYQAVHKYEKIHREFDKCLNEHVNSEDVKRKLYKDGLSKLEFTNALEEIMLPVYKAASNIGFNFWSFE